MSENVKISIPKIRFTDDAKYYVNYGVDGFKEVKGSELNLVGVHSKESDGKMHFHLYVRHRTNNFEVEEICERCCQSVKAVDVEKVTELRIKFRNMKHGFEFRRFIEQGDDFFKYAQSVWTNDKGELRELPNFGILGEFVYDPLFSCFTRDEADIFDNEKEAMFFTKCNVVGEKSLAEAMVPSEDDVSAVKAKMAELKAIIEERHLMMLYDYDCARLNIVKDGHVLPEGYSIDICDCNNVHKWSMRLPTCAYKELTEFGSVNEINSDYCVRLDYTEPQKEANDA